MRMADLRLNESQNAICAAFLVVMVMTNGRHSLVFCGDLGDVAF
jgi:hypothetical protein